MKRISSTFLLLFTLQFANSAIAQPNSVKLDFHDRGMQLLKSLEDPEPALVDIAFKSAASLDAIESFLDEYEMVDIEVFRQAASCAGNLPNLDLVFQYLRPDKLSLEDGEGIANLAFEMGRRRRELAQLLEPLDSFLKDEPSDDPDLAPEESYKRRIDEIRYHHRIGLIQRHAGEISFEQVGEGISNPTLRQYLKAYWLISVGGTELNAQQIGSALRTFKSRKLAGFAALSIAEKLDPPVLKSEKGSLILTSLIDNLWSVAETADEEEQYDFEFQHFESPFEGDFPEVGSLTPKSIELFRKSKLVEQEAEFFRQQDRVFFKNTYQAEAKPTKREGKEADYSNRLKQVQPTERPKWIVNSAVRFSPSGKHNLSPIPDDSQIVEAFTKHHAEDPKIAKTIANFLNSFTPPTAASKQLLFRLMKVLPESKQIVTQYEIEELNARVRDADIARQQQLLEEALVILGKMKEPKSNYASSMAFAFAYEGNNSATNRLLKKVSGDGNQAWALFHCSIAFPPRSSDEENLRYWNRMPGGVF